MFPTQIRRADALPQYRSPYGPKYAYQPHVAGITSKTLLNVGIKSAGLGGVALFAVIFYASGIPKVQRDVLQKVPFIGSYFVNVVAPEDNVCVPHGQVSEFYGSVANILAALLDLEFAEDWDISRGHL
ncbi:hypothetical protein SLS53_004828 [Cytospora paraplurivora]|uniref:Uncharacterized protein n=1 Tax=Cytospora paraplurivora TaxID=2898453 RepID=A0AAN9U9P1_9PEZI